MPTAAEPALSDETRQFATCIAMVIRNALEDFHCQHLSDDQMRQLNPIIRSAVATALHALDHYNQVGAAHRYVDYHCRSVPNYWEPAQLLEGYVQMWRRGDASFEPPRSGN